VAERTAVVFTSRRRIACDDLCTAIAYKKCISPSLLSCTSCVILPVGLEIDSLALKTVIVSNIVSIFLLEFIVCDVGKGLSPEYQGLFHAQSNTLQKQAILKSASVLEMLIGS
jgi:hypothetical protein